jgi:transcriptional regulator with XRE-family HTH domain
MDTHELAAFLRTRRERLTPAEVGLPERRRRRTPGLRREEVAALAAMSTDYYSRLEGGRGPQPSEPMLTAISRALHLTLAERDHLFILAGQGIPVRASRADHVSPGLLRIVDRLADTPAVVLNRLAETLVQTRAHIALEGDHGVFTGQARSAIHRWFAGDRTLYPEADQPNHSRILVSTLRSTYAADGPNSRAGALVKSLRETSPEFAALWADHEVGVHYSDTKTLRHQEVGDLELHCQMLHDVDQQQTLLVFTATPGTASHEKLQLLAVVGGQRLTSNR